MHAHLGLCRAKHGSGPVCWHPLPLLLHVPGRLLQVSALHVKSHIPATFIGVYQHVWRTHLGHTHNTGSKGRRTQQL